MHQLGPADPASTPSLCAQAHPGAHLHAVSWPQRRRVVRASRPCRRRSCRVATPVPRRAALRRASARCLALRPRASSPHTPARSACRAPRTPAARPAQYPGSPAAVSWPGNRPCRDTAACPAHCHNTPTVLRYNGLSHLSGLQYTFPCLSPSQLVIHLGVLQCSS